MPKNCVTHKLVKQILIKLHRKIKHTEKVCRTHNLGSYAQGQGRHHVRGQNRVSAITQKLLKQRTRVDNGCFWPHVQN